MSQRAHIPETVLSEIWREQKFNRELVTETGEKIEVMYVGDENLELGGPDFINARLKIGNLTYLGDIEIDNTQSDWKNHGHNVNRRFNKVVLHCIVNNESHNKIVYTQDGRIIPTFCIAQFVDKSVFNQLRSSVVIAESNKTNKIHCYKVTSFADDKAKLDFLSELGISRFKKKCERMVNRIRELIYNDNNHVAEPVHNYSYPGEVYDMKLTYEELGRKNVWEQLFYEELFEALGYSPNKTIMLNLARAADVNFLRMLPTDRKDFTRVLEAVFFEISGLIPEEYENLSPDTVEYIRKTKEIWLSVKEFYSGQFFNEPQWHFTKIRPFNFPTIRLAAGARLMNKLLNGNLIDTISRKFMEIHKHDILKNSVRSLLIVKGEGYWLKHFTFQTDAEDDLRYFLGNSRADEIMINVLYPFMYIYFQLFGRDQYAKKVLEIYSETQQQTDNNLVREVAESLKLEYAMHKAIVAQGMIELFRGYCAKDKCSDCPIGEQVFSEEI